MALGLSGPSHLLASRFRQARHENVSMTHEYVQGQGQRRRRLTYGHIQNPRLLLLAALASLAGCNGAPSRNILGSYFPSWMVCALVGIAVAGAARVILRSTNILQEIPAPFVVLLAIGCAATFAMWLLWL